VIISQLVMPLPTIVPAWGNCIPNGVSTHEDFLKAADLTLRDQLLDVLNSMRHGNRPPKPGPVGDPTVTFPTVTGP